MANLLLATVNFEPWFKCSCIRLIFQDNGKEMTKTGSPMGSTASEDFVVSYCFFYFCKIISIGRLVLL